MRNGLFQFPVSDVNVTLLASSPRQSTLRHPDGACLRGSCTMFSGTGPMLGNRVRSPGSTAVLGFSQSVSDTMRNGPATSIAIS